MIRAVTHNDIPACTCLIRESFMTVAEEYGITKENAPRFTAFAISEAKLLQQLDDEHRRMFVYENNGGELIGFYSLLLGSGHICDLNNLAVLPAFRHKGIGQALLNHAFDTARNAGCETVRISIVEENKKLRLWYERYGLIHTGTCKFDFFPFTCGYMEKDLRPQVT